MIGGGNVGSGISPTSIPGDRIAGAASADKGIDIVLGAQWGDEGKGKLVDLLSQVRS